MNNKQKTKSIQLIAIVLALIILCMPFSFADSASNNQGTINFEYDENGNLVKGIDEYYVYNSLNQLIEIKENNANGRTLAKYFYDETSQRIKKITYDQDGNSKITYYIDKNYVKEKDSNGEKDTTYYYDSMSLVAEKDQDENYKYYHPNHLGSTHIITDENGELIEETTYKPFGLSLDGGESRYTYTGQEDDKESQLMYYNARYYSPLLRHFTQPDIMIQDTFNPQSLNRYSYAQNNPVKNSDPSGNFVCGGLCIAGAVILIGVVGGATIGGGGEAIRQVWTGEGSLFEGTLNWKSIGKSAAIGGVAGGVGAGTFGVGTAIGGAAGVSASGMIAVEGVSSAVAGITAGQAARATENTLYDRPVTEGLGDLEDMGYSALIGVFTWGALRTVSTVARQFSKPTPKVNLQSSKPQNIPIKDLQGIHKLDSPKTIFSEQRIAGAATKGPIDVYNVKGKLVIGDGHGRTARAAILGGKSSVTGVIQNADPANVAAQETANALQGYPKYDMETLIQNIKK